MKKTADKIKKWAPLFLEEDASYHLSSLRFAPELSSVVYEIKKAFAKGIIPEKYPDSSHVYFLKDEENNTVAVFKTDRYVQEYTAYRLDHLRFANVPPTAIATFDHPYFGGPQTGSLQLFVDEAKTAVEAGHDKYRFFSAESVRRMAALDVRLLNSDRHTSNILVTDENVLFPIDHEFVLPNKFYIAGLSWIFWEQAATPFSEEELYYIMALDAEGDRKVLMDELGYSEELANRYFIACIFLKSAAFRKLTPSFLGKCLKRKHLRDENFTVFEILLEKLQNYSCLSWTFFSARVYEEVEKTLDEHAFDT